MRDQRWQIWQTSFGCATLSGKLYVHGTKPLFEGERPKNRPAVSRHGPDEDQGRRKADCDLFRCLQDPRDVSLIARPFEVLQYIIHV